MDVVEIESNTMYCWVEQGTVVVVERGEENVYAVDEFGHVYFAKEVNQ